jgi:hypothetical protein
MTVATKAKAPVKAPARNRSKDRIEEIRARRKARGSVDVSGFKQRLAVPEDLKDPDWEYRWVVDKEMRVHQLRQDDWEVVQNSDLAQAGANDSVGTSVERLANEQGKSGVERTILMRKPKEFYNEDKAALQKKIDKDEQEMMRGAQTASEGLTGPEAYVPAGNSIKHGR